MRAFHPEFAHVRNIEYTNSIANSQMFVADATVFNRHIITCKFMHFCTQCNVYIGKCCCFHLLIFYCLRYLFVQFFVVNTQ